MNTEKLRKIRNIERRIFLIKPCLTIRREQMSEIAVNIADISWTRVDTASFVLTEGAYLLGLTGQPAGLRPKTIAGFAAGKPDEKKQVDLLKPVLDDFITLENQIYQQLHQAYDSFYEKACESLRIALRRRSKASMGLCSRR